VEVLAVKRIVLLATFVLLPLSATMAVHAQSNSGPAAGSKLPPLTVAAVTGDGAGDDVEFVARRAGKPTIYLFVQADKWDRPVGRFIKTLDQELAGTRADAAMIAVWLTDDVEMSKEYLPRAQQSINLAQTSLCVYPGDKNGPAAWSIDPRMHLTAVVADKDRVIDSLGYVSLNETNVPEVLAKLPEP
jgi:hypothetical protein